MSSEQSGPAEYARLMKENSRRLAPRISDISDPGQVYAILGSLASTIVSVQHVLKQLAYWHDNNTHCASSSDGKTSARREPAPYEAQQATVNLSLAASYAAGVHATLGRAIYFHSSITWRPPERPLPPVAGPPPNPPHNPPAISGRDNRIDQ